MSYAELVCRTNFSLLRGASHPEELFERAARAGLSHLGVADRDGVYGLVRAHRAARDTGVRLICGASLTLVASAGSEQDAAERPPAVLLARSRQGWANLCQLLTRAHAGCDKGHARTEIHRLAERAEGLCCVLGHGWSPAWAEPLREAFGPRLVVGLSRQLGPGDAVRTRWARSLARALEVPIVATNEVLYARPEDRPVADVLSCIRRRCTLAEAGLQLERNAERYLLEESAFRHRFRDLPAAVVEANRLARRCTFSLDALEYRYPPEVVPDGWTPMTWLRELVRVGLEARYGSQPPTGVREQVQHELAIIEELKFSAYFLTVYDIVRFARERGILCQGRGSAANSAVCFVLGITAVDPGQSSLLFERFISRERGEPPDIDVDFEHERREEVLQYVYRRYGRDRAALVNEVISYRRRSAIRDVGKAFGLSLDQVDRLAKCTDRWSAGEGARWQELVREAGLDPEDSGVRRTLQLSDSLRGFPRHLSIHVGGFVIAAGQLVELVPVEPATMADRTVIQWDKYDVEALRFVKVDVLGLGMLTAIRRAFELIEQAWGRSLELATVPAEDPAVYDMFCAADTVGVFQIESRAQQSMLPRLRPRCFYDLVIEVALVRPGPIQGGMVHPYLQRRRGEAPVEYAHPDLEPILSRTLGVPLFQEQVMAMAVAVGGFTPGEADELRRAMGAWRKRGNLDGIGRRLVQGMIDRGVAPEYAEAVFQQILGFGEYGFPESHAASFALLVYISGWIKCHYPAAFAAALINSQPMGFYSPRALVADAQRHGVEVRPVCVLASEWDCSLEVEEGPPPRVLLRIGLRQVQGLGEEDAQALIEARQAGPFESLADLAARSRLSRGALRALADANALARIEPDRRRAAWVLQGLWTELPLLAGIERSEPEPDLPIASPMEELRADYRSVGLSVHSHPVALIRPRVRLEGWCRVEQAKQRPAESRVRVIGLVANRQRPGTANGVVFMTLEDETGMLNLVVWPRTWARVRRVARHQSFLAVDGRVQREGEAVSVLVEHIHGLQEVARLSIRSRDFR